MRSIFSELKKINQELKKTETPEYQQAWIETCSNTHYPHLLNSILLELVEMKSEADIPLAMQRIYGLKKQGMSYLWDDIKVSVAERARVRCGTIFPQERIDQGIYHSIDLISIASQMNADLTRLNAPQNTKEDLYSLLIDKQDDKKFQAYYGSYSTENPQKCSIKTETNVFASSMESLAGNLKEVCFKSSQLLDEVITQSGNAESIYKSLGMKFQNVQHNISELLSKLDATPNFFKENPGMQGCDYIPGSYYDELGRIHSPKP